MDSYVLWLVLWMFMLAPLLWMISPRFQYLAKMFLYMFCLLATGFVGVLASIPYGRTPNNQRRIFRIFEAFVSWTNITFQCRNTHYLDTTSACILIANHQSALDVLTMAQPWPENGVAMLKDSLKYVPGFNLCAYYATAVFIDRFRKENAHKSLDAVLERIREHKVKVWIFPEGTRNSSESFLPFKKGAFVLAKRAQIPIVPIVFSSYRPFYDQASAKFDLNGHVIVEVLPPVDCEEFADVDELADECRRRMLAVFERISVEADNWHRESQTQKAHM